MDRDSARRFYENHRAAARRVRDELRREAIDPAQCFRRAMNLSALAAPWTRVGDPEDDLIFHQRWALARRRLSPR